MDWKKLYEQELAKVEALETEKGIVLENFRRARTITEQQNADKRYQEILKEIPVHQINANIYYQNAIDAGQIVVEPEPEPEPEPVVVEEPEPEEETPPMTAEEVFAALGAIFGNTSTEEEKSDDTFPTEDNI